MTLKEVRTDYKLSQQKAANIVGVPLRTYIRYENDQTYGDKFKREFITKTLIDNCEITEEKGLLSIDDIKDTVALIINKEYKDTGDFIYLFGSYAKGYAVEKSDVDLCISTTLSGLKFVALKNKIQAALHKNVDLIIVDVLENNLTLLNEILKDGIKIYN